LTADDLRAALARFPTLPLVAHATPVEPMPRLSGLLGGGPRLLIKRDDAIPFAFGGNKVRKLAFVGAHALAEGADTLITAGGVQSNHARATAAVAARLGLKAVLVANGDPPNRPTANALLDTLLGAEIVYVPGRDDRAPAMQRIAQALRGQGRHPYVIPIGASVPLGALGYVQALLELLDQIAPPDAVVHSTSSGGTQAGLIAACRLLQLPTRIIGISADEASRTLQAQVRGIAAGIGELLGADDDAPARAEAIEVDDRFVGEGYGIATDASCEAITLAARTEAIFLDPTYTAKAMAGLISYVRQQRFTAGQTVVFWHTGGQVGLFA
jgi:D-cysteine desulfhydrase family pyridoxal phosphate-dependent enzyme